MTTNISSSKTISTRLGSSSRILLNLLSSLCLHVQCPNIQASCKFPTLFMAYFVTHQSLNIFVSHELLHFYLLFLKVNTNAAYLVVSPSPNYVRNLANYVIVYYHLTGIQVPNYAPVACPFQSCSSPFGEDLVGRKWYQLRYLPHIPNKLLCTP